jgi:hypothetical protein
MQVQYLTNEQGQRTAVLLDVNEYRRLVGEKSIDPELLLDLSQSELEALANSRLAPDAQERLDTLLNEQKTTSAEPGRNRRDGSVVGANRPVNHFENTCPLHISPVWSKKCLITSSQIQPF